MRDAHFQPTFTARADRWHAVAALAGQQHGIVTTPQLRELSFSTSAIAHAVASGRLHRIYRGVHAVGHGGLTREASWQAAVFTGGDGAALSHLPAAQAWDILRLRRRHVPLHVTVPHGQRTRAHTGVTFHSSRDLVREVTTRNQIRVTNPTRTIIDLAAIVDDVELVGILHEAEFREVLDLARVEWYMERAPLRRGIRTLRTALADRADDCAGVRSHLELGVVRAVRARGAPRLQAGALVETLDGFVEVDIFFARQRVCVEVDGPGHRRSRTRVDDEVRDARLIAAGFQVVRLDYAELDRAPERTLDPVFTALRTRERSRVQG